MQTTRTRPDYSYIHTLLKQGKIGPQEFIQRRDEIDYRWKTERYRICSKCQKKKLLSEFIGFSKYCIECKREMRTTRIIHRRKVKQNYVKSRLGNQFRYVKMVTYALKKLGILVPKPCEVCRDLKTHAHHLDYNKPWEVMWLCNKHHKEWHRKYEPRYIIN